MSNRDTTRFIRQVAHLCRVNLFVFIHVLGSSVWCDKEPDASTQSGNDEQPLIQAQRAAQHAILDFRHDSGPSFSQYYSLMNCICTFCLAFKQLDRHHTAMQAMCLVDDQPS